jgi:hypothetical protein
VQGEVRCKVRWAVKHVAARCRAVKHVAARCRAVGAASGWQPCGRPGDMQPWPGDMQPWPGDMQTGVCRQECADRSVQTGVCVRCAAQAS